MDPSGIPRLRWTWIQKLQFAVSSKESIPALEWGTCLVLGKDETLIHLCYGSRLLVFQSHNFLACFEVIDGFLTVYSYWQRQNKEGTAILSQPGIAASRSNQNLGH